MYGWILVIATTFYDHGVRPTIYQMHDFPTEERCMQFKRWVEKREADHIKLKEVYVECVKK